MKTVDYLDPQAIYHDIVSQPTIWCCEDGKRKYVRIEDSMSITQGQYGIVGTLDEWKILTKIITPEVLTSIKQLLEDFEDMKRMDIRYCYGEREKRAI